MLIRHYSLIENTMAGLALDGLTGDVTHDVALLRSVKAGMLVTPVAVPNASDLFVKVCGPTDVPIGWVINDPAGGFYENTPYPASGKIPFVVGGVFTVDAVAFDATRVADYKVGSLLVPGVGGIMVPVSTAAPAPTATASDVASNPALICAVVLKAPSALDLTMMIQSKLL
jgi:hypothetical protein